MAEYEAKRAKMLKEYNDCINQRADELPIMKISYRISSSHDATMRITRGNDPLNLVVHNKFRLNTLGFSEWLEVHALASKTKSKSNDQLLKNLRSKFQWIISQAQKLDVPPPQELSTFGISANNKKRKRTSELIKEVVAKEDIVVDGMHKNLIPPLGVEGRRGLVIREPEAGIFYYNWNFELVFQRESKFHLATIPQLVGIWYMANTVMHKFWDSALNLDPPDDYDDSQSEMSMSAIMTSDGADGGRSYPSLGLGNSFDFKFEDLRGRVHRFTFGTENLSELVSAVTHRMGGNIDHSPQLVYDDDEGDRVLLTTDSDLVGAVNHARSAGQKVLRLHLDNSEFGQRKRESQLGTVMEERTTENPKSSHVQTGILASAAVIAGIACVVYLKRNIVGRSMKFLPFASGVLFVRLMT
ncbi:CBS domain-containing protein CBSCBSPB3-like protein [Tanacetum coccineum]|uniref:CBS domain-containing protein CBSCBSPB3-like protein n=1 Tax=Tanacetum coccineum TaxID=301880 RepID=A0ABQ5IGF4_9ASTR